ncbi:MULTISPECIES: hypothetical protein [Achromobacter]|jgi:hypothetical protein|uniref:hypothetical protein n=1 Tax=Achromobacter TaxID=222 RepID=UPI001041AFD1|nr:hypothetical protein [Achromobacter xylosoxidans]
MEPDLGVALSLNPPVLAMDQPHPNKTPTFTRPSMARPSILPLPQDVEQRIAAGLARIDAPSPGNNRDYLRQFIELIHQVTGSVYGASTYLQLLKQFAPQRRPSATTVHEEVRAYKTKSASPRKDVQHDFSVQFAALQQEMAVLKQRQDRMDADRELLRNAVSKLERVVAELTTNAKSG